MTLFLVKMILILVPLIPVAIGTWGEGLSAFERNCLLILVIIYLKISVMEMK